jgi:hypothetical protein
MIPETDFYERAQSDGNKIQYTILEKGNPYGYVICNINDGMLYHKFITVNNCHKIDGHPQCINDKRQNVGDQNLKHKYLKYKSKYLKLKI